MAKRKIDNLTPESSASEMEEALKDLGTQTNAEVEPAPEPKPEEVVEEKKTPVETKPAEVVEEKPKETTEVDEFGGDYSKLRKSYKEAYGWNTKMAQDMAEMRKNLQEMQETLKPKPQEPTMTQDQYLQWYEQDPLSATRWLARLEAQEQIKSLQNEVNTTKQFMVGTLAQNAVTRMKSSFSDFSDFQKEITEEVMSMPKEIAENPAYYDKVLDIAYWAVKGRKTHEAEDKAREAGRKEAIGNSQAKKASFVEGAGSKVSSEPATDFNKMSSNELYEYLKSKGAAP